MSTNECYGPAPKDRADELSDKLRLVRDALSLDLGDGVDVVDGARACREERDRLRSALPFSEGDKSIPPGFNGCLACFWPFVDGEARVPVHRECIVRACQHIEAVNERREELSNLVDALRAFAQHEPMCKAHLYPGIGKCGCGLHAVLEQARTADAVDPVATSQHEPTTRD